MKKILLYLLLILILIGAFVGYRAYQIIYAPNVINPDFESAYIYVHPEDDLASLMPRLEKYLQEPEDFTKLAAYKDLNSKLKPGRYALESGMSNNVLVNRLRAGIQEPVRVIINMAYDLAGIAGQAARYLQPDSTKFLDYLRGPQVLEDFNISAKELPGFFLANTYEFYWNTDPKGFVKRMLQESTRFWEARAAQLEASSLNRSEIIILASIVESETAKADEMPKVAGLYLNRLRRNMKLQSDPTLIYILKQSHPDTVIRRVYNRDKLLESPYNTYKHVGLPPGPIRIPDPRSIDAVLNADQHNYIFMCADPDRPGYHAFARSNAEHERNANRYRQWATENGIR